MTWDESKHPRVPAGAPEGGQFTDKEGLTEREKEIEALRAARRAAMLPEDPNEEARFYAYKVFHDETKAIAEDLGQEKLQHEIAYLVDEEGNIVSQLGEIENAGMSVRFSDEELEMLKGRYMVHNHPNESMLSSQDLGFGAKYGLKGIVATTEKGMYVADFNRERIDQNINFWPDALVRVHKELSGSLNFQAMNYIEDHGWAAEEAMEWKAKELVDMFQHYKDVPKFVKVRFIPWEIPEQFLPGGIK